MKPEKEEEKDGPQIGTPHEKKNHDYDHERKTDRDTETETETEEGSLLANARPRDIMALG
ncbi:hypothetical protein Hypma_003125 [Hypsizygus marmoreus]|uniref:Uncharacterized protein n=1 Tax=Hypsizygus marmoreus TaxID=39966 RepID=A0A369J8Y2_HYPMA|nr:hypothetical protein Hypma_003125 [Hypsizygus marmoreus]